ncbi:MAG TPA: hypothetical protein VMB34_12385 [Acetobacteraceae bacterium]|nr:hypothetical protein [Acetobacteraceae bacterium]
MAALIAFPAGVRPVAAIASLPTVWTVPGPRSERETHCRGFGCFYINPIAEAQLINGAKSSIFDTVALDH